MGIGENRVTRAKGEARSEESGMEKFGRKSQQTDLEQDKGNLHLRKRFWLEQQKFDCKKVVLLKLLLEPEDLPEDIGEIRDRNKRRRHGARAVNSVESGLCLLLYV